MNVGELLELLEHQDPTLPVIVPGYDGDEEELGRVDLIERPSWDGGRSGVLLGGDWESWPPPDDRPVFGPPRYWETRDQAMLRQYEEFAQSVFGKRSTIYCCEGDKAGEIPRVNTECVCPIECSCKCKACVCGSID